MLKGTSPSASKNDSADSISWNSLEQPAQISHDFIYIEV